MHNKEMIRLNVQSVAKGGRIDAQANRAKIIRSATQLFAEQTVADVTMQEIAESADVGKGTLYRHFPNKGALCLALLDDQMRAYQDEQLRLMRAGMIAGTTTLTILKAFMAAFVTFVEQHSPLLREAHAHSDDHLGLPHFWQFLTVRSLLQRAVRLNELPVDFDTDYWADLLLAPLAAKAFYFQRRIRGYASSRIIRRLQSLIDQFPNITA